jgi:ABC-type multidrug transport system fused ATPase/permease subunit
MIKFLLKVWGLAKPYRLRLFLGVLTGVLTGLVSPLVIGTVMFVYSAVFPTPGQTGAAQLPMQRMPEFIQNWFYAARQALESGAHAHPWMILALIAAIPFVMLLSGVLGYLNVYLLQWVASRAVADMRVRLFRHLLDLSAGFYSTNSSSSRASSTTRGRCKIS